MRDSDSFELLREQEIPEINTQALLYRHIGTGAQVLSLTNDDENKVFGITFRTPPRDSTGLPHIMEHAVLAGSRKYPVKEPFVELLKGSLSTFVNAMTYPDMTTYPVASQNVQDFRNLIDVYLDAVFFPLLRPHILQQEGWHYELDELDNPLIYKGVVYNEMKGAYSSPDNLLESHSQRSLFPDTPYGFDSGGDPADIPNLTYEQFKSFHETYYHPSNARIFFHGDDDPGKRLDLVRPYLDAFGPLQVSSSLPLQPSFDRPRQMVIPYDAGEESDQARKGILTMNWLLTEDKAPVTALGLIILEHVLVGTPASPLRKALIDSGLGEDLAGVGLEAQMRQAYFSTGLKGMAVEDTDQVNDLILGTLRQLSQEGIDRETLEASLNTVEFDLRENNTGRFPRGISLMLRSLTTWLYDGDPLAPLAFEAPLEAIKRRVEAGEPYFEGLIDRFLVRNPHRTTVTLKPEAGVRQRQDAAEAERLAQVRARMNTDELLGLIEDTETLRQLQATPDPPEALATIPTLTLADLDKENKLIPLETFEQAESTVLLHDLFTNGIIYLDVGLDLHTLPQGLLPLAPLFGHALIKMGTETEDYVRLSQRIGRQTGGIRPATFASAVRGAREGTVWLFLRGKATVDKAQDLLDILRDILLTVRLDNQERFRQMLLEIKAQKETGLLPLGHQIVHTRLKSRFSEGDWAAEQMSGVDSLFLVRQLAEQVDRDWPGVLARLEEVRRLLLNRRSMLFNVTLDEANWSAFRPRLTGLIESLPAAPVKRASWAPEPPPPFEGLTIPAKVNYVAKGANLYELGYQLHGSVSVITHYLNTTWLWERIRIQGGAYGGGCTFDRHSGVLGFYSYRDPNLLNTIANYDGTSGFLNQLELESRELSKSIIGAIGRIDDYQLPDAKGYTSLMRYLVNESDDERQRYRDQVLATTGADLKAFAATLEQVNRHGPVVVLGSQEAIHRANEARPGWLELRTVL
jgi:Zn-dependent M16 (insulinase) family peptidase